MVDAPQPGCRVVVCFKGDGAVPAPGGLEVTKALRHPQQPPPRCPGSACTAWTPDTGLALACLQEAACSALATILEEGEPERHMAPYFAAVLQTLAAALQVC
jgi:hypothetical protein